MSDDVSLEDFFNNVVSDENGLKRDLRNTIVSHGNKISTTAFNSRDKATLAAGATFQGAGEDVSGFGRVGVAIHSDNATDGTLTMEVSHDGVTYFGPPRFWDDTSVAVPKMWNIVEKFFRIKYVNGTTEALNLSIQVQYSNNADIILGHEINEILPANNESVVVRPTNSFDLDTARIHIKGQSADFFFGHNLAVGDAYEDIWPNGGDYPWQTVAAGVEVISTNAADDSGREVTKVVADSRTNTSDGQYFDIDAQDGTTYRVYMDTTGADVTQPAAGGRTLTKVDIFTGVADTATGSGDALALVLDALSDFGCPSPGNGTVYATDANAGTVTDAANGNLGNAWAITTHAQGATEGLGVISVEIHGLSDTGVDQKDILFTHGTTASPPTVKTYIRMNLVHNENVGTYGGSHQGNVSIQKTGGGTVLSVMGGDDTAGVNFGYGEAQNGFTSIPLGKVAYLTRIEIKPNNLGTNKHVSVALMEREDILNVTTPFGPRRVLWSEEEFVDPIIKVFKSHIKIKALADIWFRAKGSAASKIAVSCDYYLVNADANGA